MFVSLAHSLKRSYLAFVIPVFCFFYSVMKRNEGVGKKARDFDKQGGFLAWHEVCDESGSKAKQMFYVKKHRETSITCLLPSVGRRLAHQPATGSVARRKNIRWDAEQEE